MNIGFVKFLRRVGGGTSELDNTAVSQRTRNYYTALGAVMIIVATISASVAGFTWATVMHTAVVGVAVVCVWWCLSLALNYLLALIIDRARGRRGGLVVMLTAILILGALVSAVNTNFIMLHMMDAEIRQKLQADYQVERADKEREIVKLDTDYRTAFAKLTLTRGLSREQATTQSNQRIAKLQADADAARAAYTTAFDAYTREIQGLGPLKLAGDGPRAKAMREKIAALKAEKEGLERRLDTAKADEANTVAATGSQAGQAFENEKRLLDDNLAAQKDRLQRDIQEMDLVPRDGFVNRDLAMWDLFAKDFHWMFIFMALFFVIEIMVALIKILMGRTDYHMLLEAQEAEHADAFGVRIATQQDAHRARTRRQLAEDDALREHEHVVRMNQESRAMEAATARRRRLQNHLEDLKQAGMPDEEIERRRNQGHKELDKLEKTQRKGGLWLASSR